MNEQFAFAHAAARLEEAREAVLAELWKAQLTFWPDSVPLSIEQMYRWADVGVTERERLRRFMCISLAMQCGAYVFYRTKPLNEKEGYIGCRFGVDGPDYFSGFES